MAAECFCGCGRPLRFGKKKLSKRGADASAWVATLERTLDELDLSDQAKDEMRAFCKYGHSVIAMYRDLVHDHALAPKMDSQVNIMSWERNAKKQAAVAESALENRRTKRADGSA